MLFDDRNSKKTGPEVRLRGLYDARRSEELSDALIPVIKGEIDVINMTDVEHIERVALTSFVPLIKRLSSSANRALIGVVGMNDDVKRTFDATGLAKYFQEERRGRDK